MKRWLKHKPPLTAHLAQHYLNKRYNVTTHLSDRHLLDQRRVEVHEDEAQVRLVGEEISAIFHLLRRHVLPVAVLNENLPACHPRPSGSVL